MGILLAARGHANPDVQTTVMQRFFADYFAYLLKVGRLNTAVRLKTLRMWNFLDPLSAMFSPFLIMSVIFFWIQSLFA